MTEFLTGPYGGTMALAFGSGCAAGWSFAVRTTLSEARRQLAEARSDAKIWRDKYLAKLEGQQ